MTRPAGVIAALVVVLVHALLVVGRTVASVISLSVFVLTHTYFDSTRVLLLSGGAGAFVGLLVATGDVLLVVWFWRAAPRARVVLTVWLALSGLLTIGNVVSLSIAVADPGILYVVLPIVQLALCVAAVVLLWLPQTTAWLRSSSVGPARPGL